MMIEKVTPYDWDRTKVVASNAATPQSPQWWKITFSQPTSIKTTLFINRDDGGTDRFPFYAATVGDNTDVTQNPVCVSLGAMTDSGWYPCPNSMIGTTFGVYSTDKHLNFVEVMAYSQEAIHFNAGVTTLSLGTSTTPNSPINAIQKIFVLRLINPANSAISKCVSIQPPSGGGLATQSIKFEAQTLIKAVVLLPGYNYLSSDWSTDQTNVAISGKTVVGTLQLCGVTVDYYATKYFETPCEIQANEIILVQKTPANSLRFCGFGVLADCDCGQSSFNRLLFTTPPATPFASTTQISVKSTDGVQQIQFNLQAPDTVSSVCGNADGFSKCGTRQLSFKDKLTGFFIPLWPYKGYSFDAVTSKLTLDSAQADVESVITVTISLLNYPAVFMSQDITAFVQGGKIAAIAFQPCIPSPLLDATINEEAFLELPALPKTSYSVTSKQEFTATFDANVLKVLSTSEFDVGTKSLQVSKISPTLNCTSQVKISFRSNTSKQSSVEGGASNTTSQALKISEDEQKDLINKVVCHVDEAKEVTCVDPENGFKFYYDPPSQQLISWSRNHSDSRTSEEKIVTLEISRINSKGEVTFKFSEDVNVEALANTSDTSQASKHRYLLSPAHLNITLNHTTYVNGSLQTGSVQDGLLNFQWYANKISPDSIVIQFVFENPLLISSEAGFRDKLNIQLLPPSFKYFTSLKTGRLIEDPLRNVIRVLPTQVKLGLTMQYVEQAAQTVQTAGQSSVAGNVAMQVILSGSFNQMWSMVNAMQITISFNQMELPMPGNVNVVVGYASDLASFNVFPTQTILSYLFKFSDTDPPGVGFESLGTTQKNLVLYLGSEYLLMHLLLFLYFFYSLTHIFSKYDKICNWFQIKLKQNLIWQTFFTFFIESYLSFAIGILLRFEQPKFETGSDQYDFALACVFCLVLFFLPLTSYIQLSLNQDMLENKEFKQKFNSFYSGLATNSELKRTYCKYMVSWFLFRRLMTAINLVQMRHETKFVQITINILLCLIDACLKLHWDPYESKINGKMQKMNDIVVLFMSEFMFCFTDLTRSEEDKYLIGWFYLGIFGYLVGSNIFVMVFLALRDVFKTLKREIFICRRDKILKHNLEWKQKRDISERRSKAELHVLKRAVNRIRLNDARLDEEEREKEKRKMRQKQETRAIASQRLEEISEVDEDRIEESSRQGQISCSASSIQASQVSEDWQTRPQQRKNREVIRSLSQQSSQPSASVQFENAYKSDWVSPQASQIQKQLPAELQKIDMAALMRQASKKQDYCLEEEIPKTIVIESRPITQRYGFFADEQLRHIQGPQAKQRKQSEIEKAIELAKTLCPQSQQSQGSGVVQLLNPTVEVKFQSFELQIQKDAPRPRVKVFDDQGRWFYSTQTKEERESAWETFKNAFRPNSKY